jgi:hypothetical protein
MHSNCKDKLLIYNTILIAFNIFINNTQKYKLYHKIHCRLKYIITFISQYYKYKTHTCNANIVKGLKFVDCPSKDMSIDFEIMISEYHKF